MAYFSAHEIEVARAHRYNGRDESIAVKLFYRRFWDFMIQFVPIWIAPNMITLIGFLLEIISFVLSFVYSDGLRRPIPSWVCIVNGVCVFTYQTLDNLDGRQARRTGSSSALGQFFDHGCDAISGLAELIKLAATFQLGPTIRSFYFVFLLGIGFFLTSWGEYVTGEFVLGPINAPDEGLGAIAICYILAGVRPDLIELAELPIWSWIVVVVWFLLCAELIGKTTSAAVARPALTSRALKSAVPGLLTVGITFSLVKVHPEAVADPFFIMSSGYVLQYLAQLLIVASLAGRPEERLFDPALVVMWVAEVIYMVAPQVARIEWFWKALFVGIIAVMVVFDVRVIAGLAKGLGIRPFSLKKHD